jgi:hypothetical protein
MPMPPDRSKQRPGVRAQASRAKIRVTLNRFLDACRTALKALPKDATKERARLERHIAKTLDLLRNNLLVREPNAAMRAMMLRARLDARPRLVGGRTRTELPRLR